MLVQTEYWNLVLVFILFVCFIVLPTILAKSIFAACFCATWYIKYALSSKIKIYAL